MKPRSKHAPRPISSKPFGHPDYYPRFGFVPASRYAIRSEYDVPEGVFMVVELAGGALDGLSGLIRYDDAFASV